MKGGEMNVTILMIGKTNDCYLKEGISLFTGRLKHYLTVDWVEIPDLRERKNLTPQQIKSKEAEILIKKLPEKCTIVLLDENGTGYTSVGFADFIQKQVNTGIKDLVFIIGGAFGVSDEIKKKADFALSLSRMTFTHQMIRLLFAEQLYRAMTIIRNEPYHNG
ncbi:MAG TPA: 23S rRNA (pseudouridine(1915)-N(3))-methyltransferase RlmH [Bacteroidales bacterium]|nr:23S rRNA (pseudouridine(1915)-N(3))-methyltransferase RlmH [Bacteroidales bacterium]HPT01238.1 23S rRNA (pseudouridine(1915)-N(3))-methyltransferase RlmH [Bacteroidales bacterium]